MGTGLLRRHRDALTKLREEEAAQEIVEHTVAETTATPDGTYACPICGLDYPHTHETEAAEVAAPKARRSKTKTEE